MFLLFLVPVWVALSAPRVFRARDEPIVWPALALALAGLAVILIPSLLGEGVKLSLVGLAAGLLAGLGYAAFQLSVKDLTKRVSAVTISSRRRLDTLIVLPLALWQTRRRLSADHARPGRRHRPRRGLHRARLPCGPTAWACSRSST